MIPEYQLFFDKLDFLKDFFQNQSRLIWTTKKTVRSNVKYIIFSKPNYFTNVQNLCQDKKSMDGSSNEFILTNFTCWIEKHQPLTIDMTREENTGHFSLGWYSVSLRTALFFKIQKLKVGSIVTEKSIADMANLSEQQKN